MGIDNEEKIVHYGTPRHSGRYPYGSGEDPEQREKSFLGKVRDLERKGLTETEIAEGLGTTTTYIRKRKSIEKAEKRAADSATAQRLKEKGLSNVAIGKRMGLNESSVRALLNPTLVERAKLAENISKTLKENMGDKGFIDIGSGTEAHLGISKTKLDVAVARLEEEGYQVHTIRVKQPGEGKYTWVKVLAPPGTTKMDVYQNKDKINVVNGHVDEEGRSQLGLGPIQKLDRNRVMIKYDEDGGTLKDGVIELRRGVDDLNMGRSGYAQVRIGIEGNNFLKGMAMYSDNLPPGVDVVYNTNKKKGTPDNDVFKPMKDDPDNPFGATINSQKGALNIVNEEGDWSTWSRSISSQVLSKQSPKTAKKQLELAYELQKEEFDEISSLTNPAVKRALLKPFSDGLDSEAVHLKAASLPRQESKVILPLTKIGENKIYAPSFRDGESVVLIRHPHGGTFEIPELVVDNKNKQGRDLLGRAKDAVGIHPKVAEKLSGADFDGDTVIVIPNKNRDIKTAPSLKDLQNFNHKAIYKYYDGMHVITDREKQLEMGKVSNLITDMTIKGASPNEIARAVRHSMVVIDAEKHKLNYKQSYIDNGIADLKVKYQGGKDKGASTIVSRAKSVKYIYDRKESIYIDPVTGKRTKGIDPRTGKKIYEETGETYINKKGKLVSRKIKSTKMAEIEDAFKLSSGTDIEKIYAEHANKLKALANKARKMFVETPSVEYSQSARKTYSKEVEALKSKLTEAIRNRPLERKALLLANTTLTSKRRANPDLTPDQIKKIRGQAIVEARRRVGAGKEVIKITDREWEAIQAGAISNHTLSQILQNTDLKALKERAMPRRTTVVTPARRLRAESMRERGYTQIEIADAIGVSVSTVEKLFE